MNTTTPYEKLIAGKLDQVPVPDMADSVWANIAMQLDAGGDGPDQGEDGPDGGDGPDQGGAPHRWGGLPGKGWFGIFGVVVVVATLWWYYDHKVVPIAHAPVPAAAPAFAPVVTPGPVVEPAAVTDSGTSINGVKRKSALPAPAEVKKDTVLLNKAPENIIHPDSASQQALARDWVPVPFFDSLSVKPRGRKPRGVKGITSDDYKISAEKDHH